MCRARAHFGRAVRHVQAQHFESSGFGRDETQEGLEHRALPGPVRTEQTHGALRKRCAYVAERGIGAVLNADLVENNGKICHAVWLERYTDRRAQRFVSLTGNAVRRSPSKLSAQAQLLGPFSKEPDDIRDVSFERQAHFLGAFPDVFPRHSPGKRLVLHSLDD